MWFPLQATFDLNLGSLFKYSSLIYDEEKYANPIYKEQKNEKN